MYNCTRDISSEPIKGQTLSLRSDKGDENCTYGRDLGNPWLRMFRDCAVCELDRRRYLLQALDLVQWVTMRCPTTEIASDDDACSSDWRWCGKLEAAPTVVFVILGLSTRDKKRYSGVLDLDCKLKHR
jgi:hypothetical protein